MTGLSPDIVRIGALGAPSLVAACGTMSVERAEEGARLAAGPHGMIVVGAGSGGPAAKLRLEGSSERLQGKTPASLFNSCAYRKSGQPPRRPLYDRPDWKG